MAGINKVDVVDSADSSPRHVSSKSGRRVKAIPFGDATTVIVREEDFRDAGKIDHPDVEWDFRVDNFTVTVGKEISTEASEFLVKNYSSSFQYVEE